MNKLTFAIMALLLQFSLSAKAATQGLLSVRSQNSTDSKQLVFTFKDDVPSYAVNHDKTNKKIEITGKNNGKKLN